MGGGKERSRRENMRDKNKCGKIPKIGEFWIMNIKEFFALFL